MKINRKKITLVWFVAGAGASMVSAMGSMIYWQLTYKSEANVDWSPIEDALGMVFIMPLGWLISLVTPAGWLSIAGLAIALYKVSFKPLFLSVAGSVLFGLFWPKHFVALMGI